MEQSKGTFCEAILKICPHYFDLFDVMKDCSSLKPQINLEELNEIIVDSSDDDNDSLIANDNVIHPDNQNDDNTESQENSCPSTQSGNNTTVEVVTTTTDIVPLATPLLTKWKKGALLVRRSIANVEMIWTWIL